MPTIANRLLRRGLAALVVLAAGALLALPGAHGQTKKSDSVVKFTALAEKPDSSGVQTVTVTMEVEKGWHTYANPVGNKDLDGSQTTVKFLAKQPVEVVKLTYPKGTLKPEKTLGDYFIYEGKVAITAQVKRTSGDTSPLEAHVTIQSCNDNTCLFPATVKVPVPVP
jgi:DsbC/DsbD-like thiol-disulfide interchange protein